MDAGGGDGDNGGMNETSIRIKLTTQEKQSLEQVARSLTGAHRDVVRAKTILLLDEDYTISDVARMVGRQRRIVRKWGRRFLDRRLKGLVDAPRSGRPARFSPRSGGPSHQAGLRAA